MSNQQRPAHNSAPQFNSGKTPEAIESSESKAQEPVKQLTVKEQIAAAEKEEEDANDMAALIEIQKRIAAKKAKNDALIASAKTEADQLKEATDKQIESDAAKAAILHAANMVEQTAKSKAELEGAKAEAKNITDVIVPGTVEAVAKVTKATIEKQTKEFDTVVTNKMKEIAVESAVVTNSKKSLARALTGFTRENNELTNLQGNLLQLQSAQPEVATAFGATQKMPQTAATATIDI